MASALEGKRELNEDEIFREVEQDEKVIDRIAVAQREGLLQG